MENENSSTYLCPYCKTYINKINQTIHELQCQKYHKNQPTNTQSMSQPSGSQSNNFGNSIEKSKPEPPKNQDMKSSEEIPCEFCGQPFPLSIYQHHVEICNHDPRNQGQSLESVSIPCDICGKSINGSLYEKHVQECQQQHQQQQQQQQQSDHHISQHMPDYDSGDDDNLFSNYSQHQPQYQQQSQPQPNMFSSQGMPQGSGFIVNNQGQGQQIQSGGFDPFSFFRNDPFLSSFSNGFNMGGPNNGGMQFSSSNMMQSQPQGNVQQQQQQQSGGSGPTITVRTVRTGPNGERITSIRQVPVFQGGGGSQQLGGMDAFNPLSMLFSRSFGGQAASLEDLLELIQNGGQHGLDKEALQSFAVVKYDKEKSKNLDQELKRCAICIEDFEDQEEIKFLLCTHRFHTHCIDPWLEKHTTCPICKKDFSDMMQNMDGQGDH